MSQRPPRTTAKAAAALASKKEREARFKAMEEERRKLNTFLKESGFVRCPVVEDGNCCYLAILASLRTYTRRLDVLIYVLVQRP